MPQHELRSPPEGGACSRTWSSTTPARPRSAWCRPASSWQQVHDHIKIAHHHLLVPPDAGGDYTGVYWTGREMALVSDLGSDQEEAIEEFRAYLQEHDET